MSTVRYIRKPIKELSFKRHKLTFISGPRQVGKTTLAKALLSERGNGNYWNWDQSEFRRFWAREPEQLIEQLPDLSHTPIVVLDEIHKARLWKRTLKGIYDTLPVPVDIIVTGSARLDLYQRGSDSLHGRYIPFRLHPFSLGELSSNVTLDPEQFLPSISPHGVSFSKEAQDGLDSLMRFGGFPEPFLAQSPETANIWRRTRIEKIVREDLRDLSHLPELSQIEMLISLLPERASQPLSRSTLREDLEVAFTTVSRWLRYLEVLYYHFELKPYFAKIKSSLKKEGKLYLWDYSEVEEQGARFENLVACHLLKACHFWTDCGKGSFELRYLRNKRGQEIDFLIVKDKKPWLPIEVKLSDEERSPHWETFLPQLPCPFGLQLVKSPGIYKVHSVAGKTVQIISAASVLRGLP